MENKEINLTNKVVLDVEDYINQKNEINDLKNKLQNSENKYISLINYLLSECKVKEYYSGKKYLSYDSYNNHFGEYLKKIEPELYEKELLREDLEDNTEE